MTPTLQSLGIDRLPIEDRLRLVEEIWDSIAADATPTDIPEWHLAEIDRRLAEEETDPQPGIPWEEAYARLKKRLERPAQ